MFIAWRINSIDKRVSYVETVQYGGKGDPYSYTSKVDRAKLLTERQSKRFMSYMKACDTQGYRCNAAFTFASE